MSRALVYPPPARPAVIAFVLAAVAMATYVGSLGHGFVFDDVGIIQRNPLLHAWSGLWRAFASPWWPNGAGQYRPFVLASYTLEWMLGGGSPTVFHALNIAWHALVSVFVFALARHWLSIAGAAVAGLLFAVHPVHVEVVANLVGRSELMAAAGVLAALLLHARRSPWAIAAFAVGLGSKEHAVVLIALAPMLDLTLPRRRVRDGPQVNAAASTPVRLLYAGYIAVTLAWMAAMFVVFGGSPVTAVDALWLDSDARTRWLTMLGVVPTWLQLWFAPLRLSADYSPQVVHAWPDNAASAAVGTTVVAAVIVASVVRWRRTARPPVALAWIVVTMAPVSNLLVPTGMITSERVLYLSSIGAVLLVAAGVERIGRRHPTTALTAAAIVAALYGARAVARVPVWESNRSLFVSLAQDRPESSMGHVLLARVYLSNGGYTDAMREYRLALALFDRSAITWIEAASAARSVGDLSMADSLLREARQRLPERFDVWAAAADIALARGMAGEALVAADAALQLRPDSLRPRFQAMQAWILLGGQDSAVAIGGRLPPGTDYRTVADSLLRHVFGGRPVPAADSGAR
jgi:protein O-mannosyl-transferase